MHLLPQDELDQVYLSCFQDPLLTKLAIEDSSSRYAYFGQRFRVMISVRWPRVYPPSIRSDEYVISFSITFEYPKLYLTITLSVTSLEATRIKVKV